MSQKCGGKDFLLGVFLGAAIGAVTALLTAPKSGKELRKDLQSSFETAKERGTLLVQNVREGATTVAGCMSDVKDRVQAKWIEIRTAIPPKEEIQKETSTIEVYTGATSVGNKELNSKSKTDSV